MHKKISVVQTFMKNKHIVKYITKGDFCDSR